ncbi:hypothetical protein ACWENQ_44905 [Nonomuraea sp. NPDC004354]
MTQPHRVRPLQPAPRPVTKVKEFGKRMFDLAELLGLSPEDAHQFGDLMTEIAQDFEDGKGEVVEAMFFDHMREATDLLPITKKSALQFSNKIYKHLKTEFSEEP